MAFYAQYLITRRLPPKVQYANGAIQFEILQQPWCEGVGMHWVFRARKVGTDVACQIASSAQGKWHLTQRLSDGFTLDEASPAARIMERLVRDGYAIKRMAPREH